MTSRCPELLEKLFLDTDSGGRSDNVNTPSVMDLRHVRGFPVLHTTPLRRSAVLVVMLPVSLHVQLFVDV